MILTRSIVTKSLVKEFQLALMKKFQKLLKDLERERKIFFGTLK